MKQSKKKNASNATQGGGGSAKSAYSASLPRIVPKTQGASLFDRLAKAERLRNKHVIASTLPPVSGLSRSSISATKTGRVDDGHNNHAGTSLPLALMTTTTTPQRSRSVSLTRVHGIGSPLPLPHHYTPPPMVSSSHNNHNTSSSPQQVGVTWDEVREKARSAMSFARGDIQDAETMALVVQKQQAIAMKAQRRDEIAKEMSAYEGSVHHQHHLEVRQRTVAMMKKQREDESAWMDSLLAAERDTASMEQRRAYQRNQRALTQTQKSCLSDLGRTLDEIEGLRVGPCPLSATVVESVAGTPSNSLNKASSQHHHPSSSSHIPLNLFPSRSGLRKDEGALLATGLHNNHSHGSASSSNELLSIGDRVKLCPLPVARRLLQLSGLYTSDSIIRSMIRSAQGRVCHVWGVLVINWHAASPNINSNNSTTNSSSDFNNNSSNHQYNTHGGGGGLVCMRIEGAPDFLSVFVGEVAEVPAECLSRMEASPLGAPTVISTDGRAFELGGLDVSIEVLGSVAYLTHTTMWTPTRDMQRAASTVQCVAHIPVPEGATLRDVAADLGTMGRLESLVLPTTDGGNIFDALAIDRSNFSEDRRPLDLTLTSSDVTPQSDYLTTPSSGTVQSPVDEGLSEEEDALDFTNVGAYRRRAVFGAGKDVRLSKWEDPLGLASDGRTATTKSTSSPSTGGAGSSGHQQHQHQPSPTVNPTTSNVVGSGGVVLVPLHETSSFHALRLKLVYCLQGTYCTPVEQGTSSSSSSPNPESMMHFEFPCSFPLRCLPSHHVRPFSSMSSFQCCIMGYSHRGARVHTCPPAPIQKSHSASGPRALFVGCKRIPGTSTEKGLSPWVNGRPIVVRYCPVRTEETQCMIWCEANPKVERSDSILCTVIPPRIRSHTSINDLPNSLGRQCFGRRVLLLIDISPFMPPTPITITTATTTTHIPRTSPHSNTNNNNGYDDDEEVPLLPPLVASLQRDLIQYVLSFYQRLSPGDSVCWCVADMKGGVYYLGAPLQDASLISQSASTPSAMRTATAAVSFIEKARNAAAASRQQQSSASVSASQSAATFTRSSTANMSSWYMNKSSTTLGPLLTDQIPMSEVPGEDRVDWASIAATEVASCILDPQSYSDRCGATRRPATFMDFLEWGFVNCFKAADRTMGVTAKGEVVKELHMVLFSALSEREQADLTRFTCGDAQGSGVRVHSLLACPPEGPQVAAMTPNHHHHHATNNNLTTTMSAGNLPSVMDMTVTLMSGSYADDLKDGDDDGSRSSRPPSSSHSSSSEVLLSGQSSLLKSIVDDSGKQHQQHHEGDEEERANANVMSLFNQTSLILQGIATRLKSVHTTVASSGEFARHTEHILSQVSLPLGIGLDLHFPGATRLVQHTGLSMVSATGFLCAPLSAYYTLSAPADTMQLSIRQTYNNRLVKKFPCTRTSVPLSLMNAPGVMATSLAVELLSLALIPAVSSHIHNLSMTTAHIPPTATNTNTATGNNNGVDDIVSAYLQRALQVQFCAPTWGLPTSAAPTTIATLIDGPGSLLQPPTVTFTKNRSLSVISQQSATSSSHPHNTNNTSATGCPLSLYVYHSPTTRVEGNEVGSTHVQGSGLLPPHIAKQLYPVGDSDSSSPANAAASSSATSPPAGTGISQIGTWNRLSEKMDMLAGNTSIDGTAPSSPNKHTSSNTAAPTPLVTSFLALPPTDLFKAGCFTAVRVEGVGGAADGESGTPEAGFGAWSLQTTRANAQRYENLVDDEFTSRPAIEAAAWEEHLDLKGMEQRQLAELLIDRAGLLRRLRTVEEGHRVSTEALVSEEMDEWITMLEMTKDTRQLLHQMNLEGAEERRRLAYAEEDARYAIVEDQRRLATVAAIVLCRSRPAECHGPLSAMYPHVTPGLMAGDSASAVHFILACIDRFHGEMRIVAFLKCASALLCEVDANTSRLLGMDGGVARCIDMIHTYIAQEEVVGSVLVTVSHIASIRACHNKLIRSGILFDVLRALRHHELSEELQISGMRALVPLAALSPNQYVGTPLGLSQLFNIMPSFLHNAEFITYAFQVVGDAVEKAPECRLSVAETGIGILHTALVHAHKLRPALVHSYFSICASVASSRPAMCVLASSRLPVAVALAVLDGVGSTSFSVRLKLHVLEALRCLCGNVADGPAAVMAGVLVPMLKRRVPLEKDLTLSGEMRNLYSRLTLNENIVSPIPNLPPSLHPLYLPPSCLLLTPTVTSSTHQGRIAVPVSPTYYDEGGDPDLEFTSVPATPLPTSSSSTPLQSPSEFYECLASHPTITKCALVCPSGAPRRNVEVLGFVASGKSDVYSVTEEAIAATLFIEMVQRSASIVLPTLRRCIGFTCQHTGIEKKYLLAQDPPTHPMTPLHEVLKVAKSAATRSANINSNSGSQSDGALTVIPVSLSRFVALAIALFESLVAMKSCSIVHGNISLATLSVPKQDGALWALPCQRLSVNSRAKATLRRAVSKYVSLLSFVNAGKRRKEKEREALTTPTTTTVTNNTPVASTGKNSMLAALGVGLTKTSSSGDGGGVGSSSIPAPVDSSALQRAVDLLDGVHGVRSPLAPSDVPYLHESARVGFVETVVCVEKDTSPQLISHSASPPAALLPPLSPFTSAAVADCAAVWETAHPHTPVPDYLLHATVTSHVDDDLAVRQLLLEVLNFGEPVEGFALYVRNDNTDGNDSSGSSSAASSVTGTPHARNSSSFNSVAVVDCQKEQLFVLLRKLPRELGEALFSKHGMSSHHHNSHRPDHSVSAPTAALLATSDTMIGEGIFKHSPQRVLRALRVFQRTHFAAPVVQQGGASPTNTTPTKGVGVVVKATPMLTITSD